jgi:hypothetical protein
MSRQEEFENKYFASGPCGNFLQETPRKIECHIFLDFVLSHCWVFLGKFENTTNNHVMFPPPALGSRGQGPGPEPGPGALEKKKATHVRTHLPG